MSFSLSVLFYDFKVKHVKHSSLCSLCLFVLPFRFPLFQFLFFPLSFPLINVNNNHLCIYFSGSLFHCLSLYLSCYFPTFYTAHSTVYPPSTIKYCPVIKLASSDAKKTTTAATSAVLPRRFIIIVEVISGFAL